MDLITHSGYPVRIVGSLINQGSNLAFINRSRECFTRFHPAPVHTLDARKFTNVRHPQRWGSEADGIVQPRMMNSLESGRPCPWLSTKPLLFWVLP